MGVGIKTLAAPTASTDDGDFRYSQLRRVRCGFHAPGTVRLMGTLWKVHDGLLSIGRRPYEVAARLTW